MDLYNNIFHATCICHICGKERLDKDILIRLKDISKRYCMPPQTVWMHVRYCSDNPECIEKSKTFESAGKVHANSTERKKA